MAVSPIVIAAWSFIDIASRMLYSNMLHHALCKEKTLFFFVFPCSQFVDYFQFMGIVRCQIYYVSEKKEKKN